MLERWMVWSLSPAMWALFVGPLWVTAVEACCLAIVLLAWPFVAAWDYERG